MKIQWDTYSVLGIPLCWCCAKIWDIFRAQRVGYEDTAEISENYVWEHHLQTAGFGVFSGLLLSEQLQSPSLFWLHFLREFCCCGVSVDLTHSQGLPVQGCAFQALLRKVTTEHLAEGQVFWQVRNVLTATEVRHTVPLPSLSSPGSIGFPVYYKRLIATIRSEMGLLSDSLPLLMAFFWCCSRHSVLGRPGRVLSGIYFGRQFLSSSAAGWVKQQYPSRRWSVDFSCVSVRHHFASSSPEGWDGNFRSVPSLLLSTQLIVQYHRVGWAASLLKQ